MHDSTILKWRNFLKESILEEEMLAEGRLQDTKKKHPNLAKIGMIDYLSGADPSGNNKYLQWSAKQLEQSSLSDVEYAARSVSLAVAEFHKYSQRLQKKDINQYRSYLDIMSDVSAIKNILTNKEKRRKEKEKMSGESSVVYESDNYFVVRPDTPEASCYFGRNTKWCISSTESQNYFEEYTEKGKVFYMVRSDKEADKDSRHKKIALVYGTNGLEEAYDVIDHEIGTQALVKIFGDEYNAIIEATDDFTVEHPPDESRVEEWIEETRRIVERYNERMSYATVEGSVEDQGDGDLFIEGSAEIKFPLKLDAEEWKKFAELNVQTTNLIAEAVMEEITEYGNDWADISDYYTQPALWRRQEINPGESGDGGVIELRSGINTQRFEGIYDVDSFEAFCMEVESRVDDQYDEYFEPIFKRVLVREGILTGGAFEQLYSAIESDEFESDIWNLEASGNEIDADIDVDHLYFVKGLLNLEISKELDFDMEDVLKIVKRTPFRHYVTDRIKHVTGSKGGWPQTYLYLSKEGMTGANTGDPYIDYKMSIDRDNVSTDKEDDDVEAFKTIIEKIDTSEKFKDAVEVGFINFVEKELYPARGVHVRQQKMKFPRPENSYNESLVKNWKKYLKG